MSSTAIAVLVAMFALIGLLAALILKSVDIGE